MAGDGVNRDTQNLGVEGFEFLQVFLVARYLFASDRRPVERIEGQNDIVLAPVIRETDLASGMRGKRQIRRLISRFQHGLPSVQICIWMSAFIEFIRGGPA
jgi:hypothetical protein